MDTPKTVVVLATPEMSPCCKASIRIEQETGLPFCKACYEYI